MLHRSFLFFTLMHVSMAGRYIYECKRHVFQIDKQIYMQKILIDQFWGACWKNPCLESLERWERNFLKNLGQEIIIQSDSVSGGWSHHSAWSSLAWRVIHATVEGDTGESNWAQTIFELFFPVSDSQKNSWSHHSLISGQLSWPSLDWVNCRVAWGHAHSYRSHTAGFKITKKESEYGCEEVPTDVTKLKSSQKIGNCLDAARSSGLSTDDVFMAGHR